MKRFFVFAAALTGLLAVSCNKEVEAPVVPAETTASTHTVSIKAAIAPGTRTSYADDKTFSWRQNDSIIIVTLSPDQDYIRLSTFYAQSSGPETIFTGEVEDGYTLYSLAFYTAAGSGVSFGSGEDNNIYFYLPTLTSIDGESEYTVESANPLANLPLMGMQQEDDSYVFYTATGAAKFTFTDIPEGAAYFAIEMSDVPLSGQFTWDDEGIITNDSAREGSYEYTGSDGKTYTARYAPHYVLYHFDRNADGTGTIYLPLPVGKIPAGASVSFYDEDLEEALYSRTVRADIPIERNKVTEVATFSATTTWESLGTGLYYDLLPFYFMNSEVSSFVEVNIEKDANMPGVYRITNPYPAAAEERGYTIPSQYELPEYLTFKVLKDNTILYDDIHTGYNESDYVSAGYGDWFGGCPAYWGEDNSYNFVAKYDENGDPEYAVLSPLYLFAAGTSYYYAYNADTWNGMWGEIYFPNAQRQYYFHCATELTEVADDDPAAPIASVELSIGYESYGNDFAGAYLVVAPDRETAEEMIEAGKCVLATESGTYAVPFPENAPSGEYYAFAKTIPAEGFTDACALLFQSDDEFDYFRSDEDRQLQLEDIIGTWTGNNYYHVSTGWTNAPVDLTLVIDESDDPLSGYPIMLTSLCPEIAQAIGGNGATVTAIPVYADFNTAHGIVTIPAGQPAYTIQPRKGTAFTLTVGDYSGKDAVLYLKADGGLQNKTNIALFNGGSVAGNTNANTTFYRKGSSAPARKVVRNYWLKPYISAQPRQDRYSGPDKIKRELIPFVGEREKALR